MTSSPGRVRRADDQHVAVLTLDRPAKLNALTSAMTAELAGHVGDINADAAARFRRAGLRARDHAGS